MKDEKLNTGKTIRIVKQGDKFAIKYFDNESLKWLDVNLGLCNTLEEAEDKCKTFKALGYSLVATLEDKLENPMFQGIPYGNVSTKNTNFRIQKLINNHLNKIYNHLKEINELNNLLNIGYEPPQIDFDFKGEQEISVNQDAPGFDVKLEFIDFKDDSLTATKDDNN